MNNKLRNTLSILFAMVTFSFASFIELEKPVGDTVFIDTLYQQAWRNDILLETSYIFNDVAPNQSTHGFYFDMVCPIDWKGFTADALFNISGGSIIDQDGYKKTKDVKVLSGTNSLNIGHQINPLPFDMHNFPEDGVVDSIHITATNNGITLVDTTFYIHFLLYKETNTEPFMWQSKENRKDRLEFLDSASNFWFRKGDTITIYSENAPEPFNTILLAKTDTLYWNSELMCPLRKENRGGIISYYTYSGAEAKEELLFTFPTGYTDYSKRPTFTKSGEAWCGSYRFDGMFWTTYEEEVVFGSENGFIYLRDQRYLLKMFNGSEIIQLSDTVLLSSDIEKHSVQSTIDRNGNAWVAGAFNGENSKIGLYKISKTGEVSVLEVPEMDTHYGNKVKFNDLIELPDGRISLSTSQGVRTSNSSQDTVFANSLSALYSSSDVAFYRDSLGLIWATTNSSSNSGKKLYLYENGEWIHQHNISKFIVGQDGENWCLTFFQYNRLHNWNGKDWKEVVHPNKHAPHYNLPYSVSSVPAFNDIEGAPNGNLWIESETISSYSIFNNRYFAKIESGDIGKVNIGIVDSPNVTQTSLISTEVINNSLKLSLTSSGEVKLKIFNLRGQLISTVVQNCLRGMNQISLSDFSTLGFYIIQISTPDGVVVKKFSVHDK